MTAILKTKSLLNLINTNLSLTIFRPEVGKLHPSLLFPLEYVAQLIFQPLTNLKQHTNSQKPSSNPPSPISTPLPFNI
jgi:hypothetical protein